MIAVIRIKGRVGLRQPIIETLNRMKIMKKYACVVYTKPTEVQLGMIKKAKDNVAFGKITDDLFIKLVEMRGKLIDTSKKTDLKKAAEEILKGKTYEEVNVKPFFRLHPPRKGIDSKKHFGVDKGVLGDNKDKMNLLVERML